MNTIDEMQFEINRFATPPLGKALRKYEKLREALVDECVAAGKLTRQDAFRFLEELLAGNSYIVLDGDETDAVKQWWTGITCLNDLDSRGASNWPKELFAHWLEKDVDALFARIKSAA